MEEIKDHLEGTFPDWPEDLIEDSIELLQLLHGVALVYHAKRLYGFLERVDRPGAAEQFIRGGIQLVKAREKTQKPKPRKQRSGKVEQTVLF